MTIKAVLTPFFATPKSSRTFFVRRPELPRNDKRSLEIYVASTLISLLPIEQQSNAQNLRSNADDPPDVFVDLDARNVGIEIAELVPRNRHGKDAVLDSFRKRILELLAPGEHTRNRVVFLRTYDAHSEKLNLMGYAEAVAALLKKELASRKERFLNLPLSAQLQSVFRAITVQTHDLRGHPQVDQELQPLLVFDAEGTYLVPEEDFPQILSATLEKKLLHDLAGETWLLIWTDNSAMAAACEELRAHTQRLLTSCSCKYSRAFLLIFGLKNEAYEVDL